MSEKMSCHDVLRLMSAEVSQIHKLNYVPYISTTTNSGAHKVFSLQYGTISWNGSAGAKNN